MGVLSGVGSECKVQRSAITKKEKKHRAILHTVFTPVDVNVVRLFLSNQVNPIRGYKGKELAADRRAEREGGRGRVRIQTDYPDKLNKGMEGRVIFYNAYHPIATAGEPCRKGRFPVTHSNTITPKLQKSTCIHKPSKKTRMSSR